MMSSPDYELEPSAYLPGFSKHKCLFFCLGGGGGWGGVEGLPV